MGFDQTDFIFRKNEMWNDEIMDFLQILAQLFLSIQLS